MKLIIKYKYKKFTGSVIIEITNSDYIIKLKELILERGDKGLKNLIKQNNGPYSNNMILTFKNIELENMFHLSKYGIKDGDILNLFFTPDNIKLSSNKLDTNNIENVQGELLKCSKCHKLYKDLNILKYHTGRLSRYEWVYGITTWWKWTCFGQIVHTPEKCFHPKGCANSICPDCRTECACFQARKIREQEEKENL